MRTQHKSSEVTFLQCDLCNDMTPGSPEDAPTEPTTGARAPAREAGEMECNATHEPEAPITTSPSSVCSSSSFNSPRGVASDSELSFGRRRREGLVGVNAAGRKAKAREEARGDARDIAESARGAGTTRSVQPHLWQ